MTPRRWPLHPQPGPVESLSSWLGRLAGTYGLSREELLRHNLGPASALVDLGADALDGDPPTVVLDALSVWTGLGQHELRAMTIAGWVPWLLDTLEPSGDAAAFDTYVRQDSVLLPAGEAKRRQVRRWRPWLPAKPMRRACPTCASFPDRGLILISQLPIVISCPEHACRLMPEVDIAMAGAMNEKPSPTPVNPHIAALDRLTHEGLTTGQVTLPLRPVHVGVWFRLLRTLLDEVNSPLSQLGVRSRNALLQIWHVTGWPIRAGLTAWRPYERLDWPRQEAMLEAAATALHLIGNGTLIARGSLGPILAPEPDPRTPDGDQLNDIADHWKRFRDQLGAAIDVARTDPKCAKQLFSMLTCASRSAASFERARQTLLYAGIPSQFLPPLQEFAKADQG